MEYLIKILKGEFLFIARTLAVPWETSEKYLATFKTLFFLSVAGNSYQTFFEQPLNVDYPGKELSNKDAWHNLGQLF